MQKFTCRNSRAIVPRTWGARVDHVTEEPFWRGTTTQSFNMVKTFQAYLPDKCHRTYSCVHCRAHLANHDELISKVSRIYFVFNINNQMYRFVPESSGLTRDQRSVMFDLSHYTLMCQSYKIHNEFYVWYASMDIIITILMLPITNAEIVF